MPSNRLLGGNTITDSDPLQTVDAAVAAAGSAAAVTPADGTDLPGGPSRGLTVETAGVYRVTLANDENSVDLFCAAGANPYRVKRVWVTGSVATTGIVALY